MKSIALEATGELKQLLESEGNGTVVLTRDGNAVYAVVPVDDEIWESYSLSTNPEFMALVEAAREEYRKDGGIPLDHAWRSLAGKPE